MIEECAHREHPQLARSSGREQQWLRAMEADHVEGRLKKDSIFLDLRGRNQSRYIADIRRVLERTQIKDKISVDLCYSRIPAQKFE